MPIIKRLAILLVFLDLPLIFWSFASILSTAFVLMNYPLCCVMKHSWNQETFLIVFFISLCILPIMILVYNIKDLLHSRVLFMIGLLFFIFVIYMNCNANSFFNEATLNYNPETVQSTMVEIDLQQLKDLQNNEETAMIYFGRPSCAHCSEIKPNLDILVNNSHSMVYYYNTEQDRDDNHDEMQTVLDIYGVETVPALVVWADAGETKEIYFNEDIVDYFLDTDRFSY